MNYKVVINQTVRKYNIKLSGIKWRSTANGGILTTLQEMDDAIPGMFYELSLTTDHPQLGKTGTLLVFQEGSGKKYLAISNDYLWLKEHDGVYRIIQARPITFEKTIEDWNNIDVTVSGNYILKDTPQSTNRPSLFEQPVTEIIYNCILTGSSFLMFTQTKKYVWDLISNTISEMGSGSGGSVTYTNPLPTPEKVGGIAQGSTFSNKTMKEMWDLLLYPELYPQLTTPSYSFSVTPSGLQEVNSVITYNVIDVFNRGLINPDYPSQSSSPRTGEVTSYEGFIPPQSKQIVLGANVFTRTVNYAQGKTPQTSSGTQLTPWPAGSFTSTYTVYGVYPVYATQPTLNKLPLQMHGTTITVDVSAGVAIIQIPEVWFNWSNLKILQYDTTGFKEILRSSFSEDQITIDGVPYRQFTSTEVLGSRKIQFKI